MEVHVANGSCPHWGFHAGFKGWIPTVLGALSFRSIGQATFPSRAKYANISVLFNDEGSAAGQQLRRRVILAFQSRNTSDEFVSSLRNFFGRKKEFYFVLRAHTDPSVGIGSERLHGEIYVFAKKKQWKTNAQARVYSIIDRLNGFSLRADQSPLKQTLTQFDEEPAKLSKDCTFHVKFGLLRSGEVSFGDLEFSNQEVGEGSRQAAQERNYDRNERLVNQCFFFLRDLAHNHQHHAPDCDTLLTLQRYDGNNPNEWKKNIVYALQYYVIDSKRLHDKSAMADALGVLAYRAAFIENVIGKRSKDIPNDEHLRDSVRARIEDEPAPGRLFASWQTILSVYAIFIAMIAILLQPIVDDEAVRAQIGDDQVGKWLLTSLPRAVVEYMPQIFLFAFLIIPFVLWAFFIPRNRKASKPKGIVVSTIMDLYALGQMHMGGMLFKSDVAYNFIVRRYYRIFAYFFVCAFFSLGVVMIWSGYLITKSAKQYFLLPNREICPATFFVNFCLSIFGDFD